MLGLALQLSGVRSLSQQNNFAFGVAYPGLLPQAKSFFSTLDQVPECSAQTLSSNGVNSYTAKHVVLFPCLFGSKHHYKALSWQTGVDFNRGLGHMLL